MPACAYCGSDVREFAEGGGPQNRRCADCVGAKKNANPHRRGR